MKLSILLSFCAGASFLWAHHSLTAEYDQKKPVTLNGTLTKLDWRNPPSAGTISSWASAATSGLLGVG